MKAVQRFGKAYTGAELRVAISWKWALLLLWMTVAGGEIFVLPGQSSKLQGMEYAGSPLKYLSAADGPSLDFVTALPKYHRFSWIGARKKLLRHSSPEFPGLLPGGPFFNTQYGVYVNLQFVFDRMVRHATGIRLRLHISPALWTQWWVYVLFVAGVAAMIYIVYRYWWKRRQVWEEARRLRSLDEIKNRFMTHITHAFRTPLMVITTPIGRALREGRPLEQEELQLIYQHGEQLKNFIDELLDLRSLEAATVEPSYVYGDLVAYIKYIVDAFQGMASAKKIDLEFRPGQDFLLMDYDRKKMQQILSHLLNNALKYSPPGERVLVSLTRENDWMRLRVADRGPGIAPQILSRIFDKFYNADHEQYGGTGIGLAIVRELTQLLGGQISVDSRPGEGACFSVKLPIRQGAPPEQEAPSPLSELWFPMAATGETTASSRSSSGDTLLIIEDNAAVKRLISYCLKEKYRLAYASGGAEGLEMAFNTIPDLVICDIMMPGMNGYEVCRRLKADERTSHVPVILLTALGDTDSRVKGLTAGADAYLPKPFDDRELREYIKQLLRQRRRLQQIFQNTPAPTGQIALPGGQSCEEDPLLLRFREKVEKELANPDFSVPQLCRELGVSHTQLHRKLKAITGLSAIQVIQSIRIEKAIQLLRSTDLSVGEIAYQTGYSDPSYFGRVFAKYTGKSPTTYREEAS